MTPASAITDDERSAFRDTLRRFVDRELMPHIDAWEEPLEWQQPRPAIRALDDSVYVTDPATRRILAVDVETGKVWREATLDVELLGDALEQHLVTGLAALRARVGGGALAGVLGRRTRNEPEAEQKTPCDQHLQVAKRHRDFPRLSPSYRRGAAMFGLPGAAVCGRSPPAR